MDQASIIEMVRLRGIRQIDIAEALGIEPDKVSKSLTGKRRFTAEEMAKLRAFINVNGNMRLDPDEPPSGREITYVEIQLIPSYAGAGGGGTGVGVQSVVKLPKFLIEDELHGRAHDFEMIEVRGDSMMPDFQHGDQILIDKRDRDPRQPGPFVLWDEDGYVVKLVERVPGKRGWYRVFSSNPRYSPYEIEETEATIRGRPVWFARRL